MKYLLLIFLFSTYAQADEAQCRSVLRDCDSALKAEQKETALQKQIIADQTTLINDQKSELREEGIWKPLCIGGVVVIGVETLILVLKK